MLYLTEDNDHKQYPAVQFSGVFYLESKEAMKMTKKVLVFVLALAVATAFSLPVLAQNVITGKIQALNETAKKITINKTEYSLSDEAALANFKVGDEVEATIEGKVVKKLVRVLQ